MCTANNVVNVLGTEGGKQQLYAMKHISVNRKNIGKTAAGSHGHRAL